MKILHVLNSKISLPPRGYGGTERVVWALAKAQMAAGHQVQFLWGQAPNLPSNARVIDTKLPLEEQIGSWPDIVHFHCPFDGKLNIPYVSTEHGNARGMREYGVNTIFLSQKHAQNHHAECYVYNGLDWQEYGEPKFSAPKDYFHFLGKASWPIKNLSGAIDIARASDVKLNVLGGSRVNFSRQFYCYLDRRLSFEGMVGGERKNQLIKHSQGLIFPVRWHEPFGLAIIESLYLGTPVFSTPYGALPEIISEVETGLLSSDYQELQQAIANVSHFNRNICHEVAVTQFSHHKMAQGYQVCYERVLAGEALNKSAPFSDENLHQLLPVSS